MLIDTLIILTIIFLAIVLLPYIIMVTLVVAGITFIIYEWITAPVKKLIKKARRK
jgi:predicted membrane protein